MTLDYVLAALFVLGLAGLIGLVLRKVSVLRVIDPGRVAQVQQQAVKKILLEGRLLRHLSKFKGGLQQRLMPLANSVTQRVKKYTQRARVAEERVVTKIAEHTSPERTWDEAMQEATEAETAGNLEKAEQAYLVAVKQDPKRLTAYEGLGGLYLRLGEYEEAREVFEYLAERGHGGVAHLGLARVAAGQGRLEEAKAEYLAGLKAEDTPVVRLELAKVLIELGLQVEAFDQVEHARQAEPRNPKILDFYIELSIVNEQPVAAQEALDVLGEVNPNNNKISDFAKEIRQLSTRLKKTNGASVRRSATTASAPKRK